MKTRILIMGGAGFLGSHLCDRLLKEGDDVLCVDNFFAGSKQSTAHLIGNPYFELIRHDVTLLLYKARVFQASTSEVYGDPEEHPQPESYWGGVNPIGPRSCYDEGKRYAETLCFDYQRPYNLDIKVVRIFNTYGPRMHPNDGRVVSNFIVQAFAG